MNPEIEQILDELYEYFDKHADADFIMGEFVPNEEMKLSLKVVELKELLNGKKTN